MKGQEYHLKSILQDDLNTHRYNFHQPRREWIACQTSLFLGTWLEMMDWQEIENNIYHMYSLAYKDPIASRSAPAKAGHDWNVVKSNKCSRTTLHRL